MRFIFLSSDYFKEEGKFATQMPECNRRFRVFRLRNVVHFTPLCAQMTLPAPRRMT